MIRIEFDGVQLEPVPRTCETCARSGVPRYAGPAGVWFAGIDGRVYCTHRGELRDPAGTCDDWADPFEGGGKVELEIGPGAPEPLPSDLPDGRTGCPASDKENRDDG